MAGMDLSGRRADRGVSVFWMILAMGAGVFALIAILLVGSDAVTLTEGAEEAEHAGGGEVIVNDGETVVVGQGNSPAASDEAATTFSGDETIVVDGPTEEGELSVEEVEVPVEPAPEAGAGEAAATEEDALMGEDAEPVAPGAGEIVVDPDGTTAPVVPTPVGPEGRDDETVVE